jgi:hypothetical protein
VVGIGNGSITGIVAAVSAAEAICPIEKRSRKMNNAKVVIVFFINLIETFHNINVNRFMKRASCGMIKAYENNSN